MGKCSAGDALEVADVEAATFGTPVPEPTTVVAGTMILLPFGVSALHMLHKKTTA